MNFKKYFLINFTLIALAPLYAQALPADFPNLLLYQNKPIDALCFEEVDETTHTTSLTECGVGAAKGRYVSGQTATLVNQDYIGYEFKEKDTGDIPGYSYYKVLGKINASELIYTVNSGGGSGEFTAIKLITRNDNTLTVETLNNGDRCNNGVEDVAVKNGALIYKVNLTPFDFLTLTQDNPRHLRAYDDLAACAACCAAKAVFSRPLNNNYKHAKLIEVDISDYSLDHSDDPNASHYQVCFDKVIAAYKAEKTTHLDSAALHTFTKQFNAECAQ